MCKAIVQSIFTLKTEVLAIWDLSLGSKKSLPLTITPWLPSCVLIVITMVLA